MKLVTVIVILCSLGTLLLEDEDRVCDDESHVCVPREDCDFYQQNVVKISKSKITAEVSILIELCIHIFPKMLIKLVTKRKPFSEK